MTKTDSVQNFGDRVKDGTRVDRKVLSMKSIMDGIQKTPLYRYLIPAEAGIGWPIPLRKQGKVYVTLPLFGYHRTDEKGKTALFPPFATITIDQTSQVPVEYLNLRFRNPWPQGKWEEQAGYFPHPAVAAMSAGQYKENRKELLSLYDELFEMLLSRRAVPESFRKRFGHLLRMLMEPCLEPFYRSLAPKFFEHFLAAENY